TIFAGGRAYGLRAEILSGGQIWFRNEEPLEIDPAVPTGIQVITTFAGRIEDPSAPPNVDPAPILGVNWTAEEIGGIAVTPEQSTISIGRDRRAGGRGGCNSYFTQAEVNGDRLAFATVAATRMACDETVMAQEAVFFDALAATRFWRLEGGKLVLLDTGGQAVMRLARSAR
ncbi:MAG TPA: META domain-containing protein, partial [Devosia sp.]